MFMVTDCQFNRKNYPLLINRFYSNPSAYAKVKEMPEPYRKYECWNCDHNWIVKVELKSNTQNLSGESEYCPKCERKFSCSSAWITKDGNPYPFPEPIK